MLEFSDHIADKEIRKIAEKIFTASRILPEEGMLLYSSCDLSILAYLSDLVRRRINGNLAFYNRNFHIEPTNRCIYNCRFCSYKRPEGDPESWDHNHEQMLETVRSFDNTDVTEVHITGGVHPVHDIYYYGELIRKIRHHRPSLHIKAYSAIELDHMFSISGISISEGLEYLKSCGLGSIPGGGAEIFDEKLRKRICPEKTSSEKWLSIHETAHRTGIPSNATMLYGHLETYENRIDHMNRLRELQDRTGGFNAFIPLKYKKAHNQMEETGEVSLMEDLRNYAVARIYLDNIPHIKAYWPMSGRENAGLSLLFGADDMDGTIEGTTRIYSMAGSSEIKPAMRTEEICRIIREAGFTPVERDSLYKKI
jgi:aminodeoxyfutalosine synthase